MTTLSTAFERCTEALYLTKKSEMQAVGFAHRYADALIAIACRFEHRPSGAVACWMCGELVQDGCDPQCPGLAARVALGVG